MRSDDLMDLIGEANDAFVEDANAKQRPKRFPRWAKWASALAACLALAVGLGGFLLPKLGAASAPGNSAGGGGHDEGSVFMSYAGPVFPLTLREENSAVSARRSVTLDFAPWVPVWVSNEEQAAACAGLTEAERQEALESFYQCYPEGGYYASSSSILVSDAYTLANSDARAQTVRLLYPFVSSLNSLGKNRPVLTLGGETLETELHAGSYAGGFQGAWENWPETHENPGSLNLLALDSWEGYRDLLADGTYLRRALGDFADLSQIPVTVYEFTGAWGPDANSNAGIPNPTIRVMFQLDYEKTTVLSYGFHAGYYDREAGVMGKGFSIREEGERGYGVPYYLIVMGDDVEDIRCQGYATGGWDTKKTVEAGVTVTRRESDLETALRQAAGFLYQEMVEAGNYFEEETDDGFELYFGLLKEHLTAYGVLSDNGAARYDSGGIEELDVTGVARVFWLEAEVTIPAEGSVTVCAAFEKDPSFDFCCAASENKGVSGYDLVTSLGSNLSFTQQTAVLEDRGQVEIVRQNFGFDPENGITRVTLDGDQPHYYLEVRKAPAD